MNTIAQLKHIKIISAILRHGILSGLILLLSNCSSTRPLITDRYTLSLYQTAPYPKSPTALSKHPACAYGSLFISPTEAVDGYQTDAMLYQDRPFEIRPFIHHAWQSNPSSMIYPLIYQSLQESHLFQAVVTGPYAWQTDYRIDTQLIQLIQNFQVKPSQIQLTIKASLTHVSDNRVIASHIWHINKPCPSDTPKGGVFAANQATKQFTHDLARFVKISLIHRINNCTIVPQ